MTQPTKLVETTSSFSKGSAAGAWKARVVGSMTPLSSTFTPGPYDVICSRGKKAQSHIGNVRFQSMIEEKARDYANADGKLGKSIIVSEIIDTVRRQSPNGGFVKQRKVDNTRRHNEEEGDGGGQWCEVGDWSAREKVSQSLRDHLKGSYKSSASSKKRKREESNAKMIEEIDSFIASNEYVSRRIRRLSNKIESEGPQVPDMYLMMMMTEANSDILKQLRDDDGKKLATGTATGTATGMTTPAAVNDNRKDNGATAATNATTKDTSTGHKSTPAAKNS